MSELGDAVSAVGVDGCPDGWVCVHRVPGSREIAGQVASTFADIICGFPDATIAIDIPIGLPDKGSRACDMAARKLLAGRGSSVFPAPIRALLKAASYEEACRAGRDIEQRALSRQAFEILPKICDVDDVVTPELQNRVFEVHPEVSFLAMNGMNPLLFSKRHTDGVRQRVALLCPVFPNIGTVPVGTSARTDDVLDAAIALWSAERIVGGLGNNICECEQFDSKGLRMQITY